MRTSPPGGLAPRLDLQSSVCEKRSHVSERTAKSTPYSRFHFNCVCMFLVETWIAPAVIYACTTFGLFVFFPWGIPQLQSDWRLSWTWLCELMWEQQQQLLPVLHAYSTTYGIPGVQHRDWCTPISFLRLSSVKDLYILLRNIARTKKLDFFRKKKRPTRKTIPMHTYIIASTRWKIDEQWDCWTLHAR